MARTAQRPRGEHGCAHASPPCRGNASQRLMLTSELGCCPPAAQTCPGRQPAVTTTGSDFGQRLPSGRVGGTSLNKENLSPAMSARVARARWRLKRHPQLANDAESAMRKAGRGRPQLGPHNRARRTITSSIGCSAGNISSNNAVTTANARSSAASVGATPACDKWLQPHDVWSLALA